MENKSVRGMVTRVGLEWLLTTRALSQSLLDRRLVEQKENADWFAVQIVADLASHNPPILFSVEREKEAATPTSPVTIQQAAIRQDNVVYTMPRPARHDNILCSVMTGVYKHSQAEQGFLTSTGQFVNRTEAARIAIEAGQVEKMAHPPYLYSEDLW